MKKFYFLFAVFFFSICGAQIVNIPDANFKAKLISAGSSSFTAQNANGNNIKIDTNNDGEIQVSEAAAVYKFYFESEQFNNIIGIQSFVNLKSIRLNNIYNLSNVDVSSLTNLEELDLKRSPINSINTQGCTVLKTFVLRENSGSVNNINFLQGNTALKYIEVAENGSLASMNFSTLTNLEELYISNYYFPANVSFSTLDLSNNINLKKVGIANPYLTNFSMSTMPHLLRLTFNHTSVTTLNLNNSSSLNYLVVEDNPSLNTLTFQNTNNLDELQIINNPLITNVNLQNRPALRKVKIHTTNISSIDFTGSAGIEEIDFFLVPFTSLNLAPVTNLKKFYIIGDIATLDLSQNFNLISTSFLSQTLTYLNLKNGNPNLNISPGAASQLPLLTFVCADDGKIQQFKNSFTSMGLNYVQVNSYCSFTPGGTFYTIQGNTKYDINSNGCDVSDPKKAFQKFNITNGTVSSSIISNSLGEYSIPVQAGSHTITPVLENPTYFNISPSSLTANFPAQTSPLNQNFCMTANGIHNDLEIVIIPITAASPGFTAKYKILYKNKGTATQSGNFSFNYDDNLMNYLNATIAPTSQSTGVLNYDFVNLLPFQVREITVTFTLNTPTATPPLVGGQILNYTAQINGATDETPLDNTFALNQTVVNSFDPNDKTCLEGTQITQTKVGDYVHYLIRFENTGTANAQNIVVKDMIDTAKYDINSLVALSGSHSFVTRITNPNTVEFIFEGIQLPFNNLYNDGYVSFKIKTKSTLVLGDSFSNTANIYFDYNAPIVTNTATTTVAQILGTQETSIEKSLGFYPNPVDDLIHFKTDEKLLKLEIYDVSGRIVGSVNVQNNEANLSFLKTGNYLIKIFTKDRYYVNKIVKK